MPSGGAQAPRQIILDKAAIDEIPDRAAKYFARQINLGTVLIEEIRRADRCLGTLYPAEDPCLQLLKIHRRRARSG